MVYIFIYLFIYCITLLIILMCIARHIICCIRIHPVINSICVYISLSIDILNNIVRPPVSKLNAVMFNIRCYCMNAYCLYEQTQTNSFNSFLINCWFQFFLISTQKLKEGINILAVHISLWNQINLKTSNT